MTQPAGPARRDTPSRAPNTIDANGHGPRPPILWNALREFWPPSLAPKPGHPKPGPPSLGPQAWVRSVGPKPGPIRCLSGRAGAGRPRRPHDRR